MGQYVSYADPATPGSIQVRPDTRTLAIGCGATIGCDPGATVDLSARGVGGVTVSVSAFDVQAGAAVTTITIGGTNATGITIGNASAGVTLPGNLLANGALNAFGSVGSVAAAGNSQGTAAAITAATPTVTGADGTKGVILPTPTQTGIEVSVLNTNASNGLKIFADAGGTGGTINGGSGNASVNLAASKGATYICTALSPTAWWSTSN
jgi:hypothetical protein